MRTGWWSMGVLGAMALASGCSTAGSQAEMSPEAKQVQQAQAKTQASMERAVDAQKSANEMEHQAQMSQANAAQKERDLAEAQAKAADDRRRAHEMQENAITLRQQANQDSEQAQADALKAQKSDQVAAMKAAQTATGKVTGVSSGNVLTVFRGDQVPLKLQLGLRTQVTLDGHAANINDLPQGADVRATFVPGVGLPRAVNIDATSPAPASTSPREYPQNNSQSPAGPNSSP